MTRIAAVLFVLTLFAILARPAAALPPEPLPDRFEVDVLAKQINRPMELDLLPDGRVIFIELDGHVKLYHPRTHQVTIAAKLDPYLDQENGLIGLAVDPDFARNGWVYLQHSPKDFTGQHISRFTLAGDALDMASQKVILTFEEQRKDCCHHAGSMEFGPDGNLFIATGDNTHPHGDSAGYAPIDFRPGKEVFDALKSSGNTHDLRGKVLRIRPTAEGGYTIPEGNLFPPDGSKGRPEIYAMGCRNPWRISVDSKTGFLYWGEVGPDAGGDGPRGPRGYDEINQAKAAGNFGWPLVIADNQPYAEFDFATGKVGGKFDPSRPVNRSPNNTGSEVLPPAVGAFIYYPYGESSDFPQVGSGGRTACAGPVYRYDPARHAAHGLPEYYDGCLLIYDWERRWIKAARLDEQSNLVSIEPFLGHMRFQRPIDMVIGQDGTLYMLEYGETWGVNEDARLIRIRYERGNRAPVARAAAGGHIGKPPLRVALSAEGTTDRDGDELSYEWRVSTGEQGAATVIARQSQAEVVFDRPGVYNVQLIVTDPHGASSTAVAPVLVGNDPPTVEFQSPADGDFVDADRPVQYKLHVRDAEDGDAERSAEMGLRVFVEASFEPGPLRLDGAGVASAAADSDPPGLRLMKRSDCFNCHAVDRKVVGPTLLEVAAKYRHDPAALDAAAQRVMNGSMGVWGQVPMLPHPQHTLEQTRQMVAWVFALRPQAAGALYRGVENIVDLKSLGAGESAAGVYRLTAAYHDAGADPVGSLTGKAAVTLRTRRVEAEHADEHRGSVRPLQSGSAGGGAFMGHIAHLDHLRLSRINLASVASVTLRTASGGPGGVVELRADRPDGPLLASLAAPPTGNYETWAEHSATLTHPGRTIDLFVVFINPAQTSGGMMNLDWLHFNAKP